MFSKNYSSLTVVVLFSLIVAGCTNSPGNESPGEVQTPTPNSQQQSPIPTASSSPIPASWERVRDEVVGYSMAHPPDWQVTKATRFGGESRITSFIPEDIESPGPVPPDELKTAVVRLLPAEQNLLASPSPETVISTETVLIAGEQGTRQVIESNGRSIRVTISQDSNSYVISAIPADSRHIEVFDQMLSSFEFIPAVSISSPTPRSEVISPLQIEGRAPGTWFFEGQIPVRVETADGRELGRSSLSASGSWMTEEEVPFGGELQFSVPNAVRSGELILSKANPSGLPENDREVRMTIQFQD